MYNRCSSKHKSTCRTKYWNYPPIRIPACECHKCQSVVAWYYDWWYPTISPSSRNQSHSQSSPRWMPKPLPYRHPCTRSVVCLRLCHWCCTSELRPGSQGHPPWSWDLDGPGVSCEYRPGLARIRQSACPVLASQHHSQTHQSQVWTDSGFVSVNYEVLWLTYPCIWCVPVFLVEVLLSPLTMDHLWVPFDPDLPPPVNNIRYVLC